MTFKAVQRATRIAGKHKNMDPCGSPQGRSSLPSNLDHTEGGIHTLEESHLSRGRKAAARLQRMSPTVLQGLLGCGDPIRHQSKSPAGSDQGRSIKASTLYRPGVCASAPQQPPKPGLNACPPPAPGACSQELVLGGKLPLWTLVIRKSFKTSLLLNWAGHVVKPSGLLSRRGHQILLGSQRGRI